MGGGEGDCRWGGGGVGIAVRSSFTSVESMHVNTDTGGTASQDDETGKVGTRFQPNIG